MESFKLKLVVVLLGALAGGIAVGLATPDTLRPRLQETKWHLPHKEFTESAPMETLNLFGDYDLKCRVELPDGGEVDLLFRRVEHWGEGARFPSRFGVLRMSTHTAGKALLSRDEALFGEAGGQRRRVFIGCTPVRLKPYTYPSVQLQPPL